MSTDLEKTIEANLEKVSAKDLKAMISAVNEKKFFNEVSEPLNIDLKPLKNKKDFAMAFLGAINALAYAEVDGELVPVTDDVISSYVTTEMATMYDTLTEEATEVPVVEEACVCVDEAAVKKPKKVKKEEKVKPTKEVKPAKKKAEAPIDPEAKVAEVKVETKTVTIADPLAKKKVKAVSVRPVGEIPTKHRVWEAWLADNSLTVETLSAKFPAVKATTIKNWIGRWNKKAGTFYQKRMAA